MDVNNITTIILFIFIHIDAFYESIKFYSLYMTYLEHFSQSQSSLEKFEFSVSGGFETFDRIDSKINVVCLLQCSRLQYEYSMLVTGLLHPGFLQTFPSTEFICLDMLCVLIKLIYFYFNGLTVFLIFQFFQNILILKY